MNFSLGLKTYTHCKMKKQLIILSFLLGLTGFSLAQSGGSMRHFMQPTPTAEGAIPYGNNSKVGKYVQTSDAKLYYEVYGIGKPMVVLHGGGLGSTYEMHRFIDSLSKNYQVIAVSTRGHGRSELGSEPASITQKANDVLAVVDAENLEKVIILGFSDGAYSGYSFASSYPSRIDKLIAIGAGEETPGLRKISMDLPKLYDLDPAFRDQQLAIMPEPNRLKEIGDRMAAFYNEASFSKDLLSKIQCHVLVLSGERDRNAPLSTVINAYQMIPHSQLSIIPNAGHVVFSENFEAVWFSIKPFLQH